MKPTARVILITLLSFAVYFTLDELFFRTVRKWIFEQTGQFGVSHNITYALSGIPLFIGTYIIVAGTSVSERLGLDKSPLKGFLFALICTLPLFIGFSFVFNLTSEVDPDTILISIVAAGFFEELFFRGFLFGMLYKYTRLGFIPAVFLGALFFGLIHLYQSTEFAELLGIFLITFLGGILFAWTYAEWKYNLWIPIFIHMLMNLSWELFSVSDNALGDRYANIFRFTSIGLIILLTVIYKKRRGEKLEINKRTVWLKKSNGLAPSLQY